MPPSQPLNYDDYPSGGSRSTTGSTTNLNNNRGPRATATGGGAGMNRNRPANNYNNDIDDDNRSQASSNYVRESAVPKISPKTDNIFGTTNKDRATMNNTA